MKEPFLVINADDYYGKEAFRLIHDYLTEDHKSDRKYNFCMAGFILKNTLSENGGDCLQSAESLCSMDVFSGHEEDRS